MFCGERSGEMREICVDLYREIRNSRWIERCRELKFARRGYGEAIKELLRGVHSKVTSMDRESIEHTKTSSMDREVVK